MNKVKRNRFIRKSHRYLGVVLGIQFLLWTAGGLYFSWTNIEDIRGDNLKKEDPLLAANISLVSPTEASSEFLKASDSIASIQLKKILERHFYQMIYYSGKEKHIKLIDAQTGELRPPLSGEEAIEVARTKLNKEADVIETKYLEATGKHHEYREKPLPAYAVTFSEPVNTTVYVSSELGTVQSFRSTKWRVFDFLWMLHTMDYQERDNFNNYLLRAFSIFGIFTILSGFALFIISSRWFVRKRKR
ncbi:hypothetical protein GWK08_13840 [Leptobacterium flavescens]|uniref:PepSY domain-containing protein n=1 Tax=Leptobacterium flavescens TaxID=472055 RepID=A0A6P0UMF3_9FLAO|nr:hypothetical protein [Leptobacterium flavescens]NER14531.1 hypothetical protein [Leptobacterium flavescens]